MVVGDETGDVVMRHILWDWRSKVRTTELFQVSLLNLLTSFERESDICCQKIILGDKKWRQGSQLNCCTGQGVR